MGELIQFPSRGAPNNVIPLPVRKPSCFECYFAAFGATGTYCTEFNESILNEVEAAADCELFADA